MASGAARYDVPVIGAGWAGPWRQLRPEKGGDAPRRRRKESHLQNLENA